MRQFAGLHLPVEIGRYRYRLLGNGTQFVDPVVPHQPRVFPHRQAAEHQQAQQGKGDDELQAQRQARMTKRLPETEHHVRSKAWIPPQSSPS